MKIKIQQIVAALLLMTAMPLTAQVLWSDDFDSYPAGTFSTGQGGWNVSNNNSEMRVVSEPGRGKVLAWGWITGSINSQINRMAQIGFEALWNTRTPGNDVMKLEYDFYAEDFSLLSGNYFKASGQISFSRPSGSIGGSTVICNVSSAESYIEISGSTYPTANYRTDYDHTWIKVEFYLDYDAVNDMIYIFNYIASLNHMGVRVVQGNGTGNGVPDHLDMIFDADQVLHSGALVKYDNFKLSAIPTRPSHLKVNEFVSSKFNIFPNPVTDVVTITNSESIGIEQIQVFDINGKTAKSLNYNNENEVQFNMADFASGTYFLHIQTNEGTAVKKLIKK